MGELDSDHDGLFPELEDEPEAEPASPTFYTVCIFLVDRTYGGPEEGGWWYDYGILQRDAFDLGQADGWPLGLPRVFTFEEGKIDPETDTSPVEDWRAKVQAALDEKLNKHRREISSVLSEGRYYAEVHNGFPPDHWPAQTPHYE